MSAGMCLAEFLTPSKHSHKMSSLSKYGMLLQDSKGQEILPGVSVFRKAGGGAVLSLLSVLHRVFPPHVEYRDRLLPYSVSHILFSG